MHGTRIAFDTDAFNPGLPAPERLYLIDILRGLASIAVVLWHYQSFFYPEPDIYMTDYSREPLYSVLSLFYTSGDAAVQLFFVISGFVFFHVYQSHISNGRVAAYEFFALRFSRLYPLHFATLIIVLTGQQLSHSLDGRYIVSPYNDPWHFGLHLFFASAWGLEKGLSLNGPVWSVSVEVLLYAVFFVFCRALAARQKLLLPAVWASWVLATVIVVIDRVASVTLVASAASFFFAGGMAALIWRETKSQIDPLHGAAAAALVFVLAMAAWYLHVIKGNAFEAVAFPSVVLALAYWQSRHPDSGRPIRLIGDITYSTYLIHFPMQLFMILAIRSFGLTVDFASPLVLIAYLAAVIASGVVVYREFELPAQRWLRQRLLTGSQTKLGGPSTAAYIGTVGS